MDLQSKTDDGNTASVVSRLSEHGICPVISKHRSCDPLNAVTRPSEAETRPKEESQQTMIPIRRLSINDGTKLQIAVAGIISKIFDRAAALLLYLPTRDFIHI